MTDSLAWLQDSTDVRVVEGLTRRCPICYVKPGRVCVDPFGAGDVLPDRLIHAARYRPDLKPKRSKQ